MVQENNTNYNKIIIQTYIVMRFAKCFTYKKNKDNDET